MQAIPLCHPSCMITLLLCRYIHLREVMTNEELREVIDPVGNSCLLKSAEFHCYSWVLHLWACHMA